MNKIELLRSLPYDLVTVAPSLLAADFLHLADEIKLVENGGAEILHLDIMDGHFVPNISFGPPIIKALRQQCKLIFDTHLMISEPLKYLETFAESGSDCITFHVEAVRDPKEVINAIHKLGLAAGISLKPKTPASAIIPYLDQLDLVLVMSVEPGFGGQSFMPEMMSKTTEIRRAIQACGRPVHLQIDGGIDEKTVHTAAAAGAAMMVAGTAVFRHRDGAARAIELLREAQPRLDV
ncbi:MAG: ribulose-phosphate 3-epimerase [Victivallaceae bacterium]|nr:ribulose-phosphate 3-epimerase [Victivallaceae bacterium]MDD4181254.1 ribulose-phosphate 3-epimerase [Victivallaceae bacterium]